MDKYEVKTIEWMVKETFSEVIQKTVFSLLLCDIGTVMEQVASNLGASSDEKIKNAVLNFLRSDTCKRQLFKRLCDHANGKEEAVEMILVVYGLNNIGEEHSLYHKHMEALFLDSIQLAKRLIIASDFREISKLGGGMNLYE